MKVIQEDYIVRLIQPRLTVLITSSSKSGDAVMAAAWITPLSYIPPIVGVAIAKERFTYKVISESGYYAVNIMNFRYVSNVADAGRISGYKVKNKFRAIGLTPIGARKIPVKVVKEADAVLECRVRDEIEVGDHNFIIGDVMYAYATEDFNLRWGLEDYLPILYISDGFFMTIDKDTIKRYVIE